MVRRQELADRALRPAMRSPGRPMPARRVEREFWRLIAEGKSTEDAAVAIGVSVPVGARWFRHAGGMAPLSLAEPTGRYLSFAEREELALLRAEGLGVRAIAREMGRDPSTISRELRRNAATRSGKLEYRATVAQWKAQMAAKRPKPAKLATNDRLREYVRERLSGELKGPDGSAVPGPPTTWKGLNKPHRADRRWSTAWSPEQISRRLVVDFPDDEDMRISRGNLPGALHRRQRCAQTGVGGVPSHRARSAQAPRTRSEPAPRSRDRRCRVERAASRGRRPGCARSLGR